ncbi:EAL domain-containing protein [Shewanella colwelliana]|uniref:EAL domain-containing protein n=1 Tax=Shewanella colwelliana TaxID=23 RepID=UPI0022AEB9EE|nr:EAL domain-containing protein [Shewanella colwelliana]MCZ4337800.1 EAL domain-containing protein [Shewanella colwelliana]
MINNASIVLHFQTITDPASGDVYCVEALGRLKVDSGRMLYPSEFFPQMTRSDMVKFDISVISQCLGLGALWHQQRIKTKISFNINGLCQARQSCLIKILRTINLLVDTGKISPSQFIIEISEQTAFKCNKRARNYLDALRTLGFLIAIDDLGAENSTLERLCILKSDIIKLDISVAKQLLEPTTKHNTLSLIKAFGLYCKLTDQKLVVEGVESLEQHHSLVGLSDFEGLVQGFYYSRPVPITTIEPQLISCI